MTRRLVVLAYHRVLAKPDPLRPDDILLATFVNQMKALSRFFRVLPLADAVDQLKVDNLPARAVALTFDDGYADNYDVAWPVLQYYRLPATIFVAAGFLDGGRMWNDTVIETVRRIPTGWLDARPLGLERYQLRNNVDRLEAINGCLAGLKYCEPRERDELTREFARFAGGPLPSNIMLTSEQIATLYRDGVDIGGHTMNHPILASVEQETAYREIEHGKSCLESMVDGTICNFAYPNGIPGPDYGPEHVTMVRRAGFQRAVSMISKAATRNHSIYEMPRFAPWNESTTRFVARLMSMYHRD